MDLIEGAKEPEMTFDTTVLPMLVPPLPWNSSKYGGYLLAESKDHVCLCIRLFVLVCLFVCLFISLFNYKRYHDNGQFLGHKRYHDNSHFPLKL